MARDSHCSQHDEVTLTISLGDLPLRLTHSAVMWAQILGVPWETVKKRRQRGDSWTGALMPGRRPRTFNRR